MLDGIWGFVFYKKLSMLSSRDIEAVSFHLSELLGCEPDDDADSYEPCFGYVFELVRSILELSEEN